MLKKLVVVITLSYCSEIYMVLTILSLAVGSLGESNVLMQRRSYSCKAM